MNKGRLLKLAALLEADAANKRGVRFDLTAWARTSIPEEPGYFSAFAFQPGQKVEVSCNTSACAWGLAAISGAFKSEGVGYKIESSRLLPTYKGKTDFDAAQAFFGITQKQSIFLFDPDYYGFNYLKGAEGERYVAKRIRDFVAGKVAP